MPPTSKVSRFYESLGTDGRGYCQVFLKIPYTIGGGGIWQ